MAQLMSLGKHILGRRHVLPSVVSQFQVLQVEGTFTTGTHLVTVDQPISSADGNIELALYGSFISPPSESIFPVYEDADYDPHLAPGAIVPADVGTIELNPGRKRTRVRVTNKGDRPIQVSIRVFTMCGQSFDDAAILGRIAFPLHRDQPSIGV